VRCSWIGNVHANGGGCAKSPDHGGDSWFRSIDGRIGSTVDAGDLTVNP
jgi:hypothetical protein